ncbi:MAG TPA: hypothetical protein VIQ79_24290 [Kribbella sp.]
MTAQDGQAWHGVQPPPTEPPAPIGERVRRRSLLDPSPSKWDREVSIAGGDSWTHFNRDDLRRQMQSMRVLEQLLKRCAADDLPALNWTVTPHSTINGEISWADSRTPFQQRDVFMAWVKALGAEWREHRGDGQIDLRGHARVPAPGAPHLEVSIALAARWWVDDEREEAEQATAPTDTIG